MDHAELVAEFTLIEQLPVLKRLELARKRRTFQLVKQGEREVRYQQQGEPSEEDRLRKVKFVASISLLDATFRGDASEVRDLLNAGVDPNSRNEDGLTPLHQCCIDENEEVLRLLIRAGADVNARDTEQWSPLHAAACCGHHAIALILVEHEADLLAVNADGNMPYDICDDEQTLDFLESEMARRGVKQSQIDFLRSSTERAMLSDMHRLHNEPRDLNLVGESGETYLHIGSANGYDTVVQYLLDSGVPVDPKDSDSWQPIHCAACWSQPHILEMLVNYGADIHAMTDNGETPFDLCEEPEVKDIILELSRKQAERFRRHLNRESRRMSKRKKPQSKFESPQYASSASVDGLASSSRVIRRQSLRDKSGATIARLEARQEALMRSRSLEDATGVDSDGKPITPAEQNGSPTEVSTPTGTPEKVNSSPVVPSNEDASLSENIRRIKIVSTPGSTNGETAPNEMSPQPVQGSSNDSVTSSSPTKPRPPVAPKPIRFSTRSSSIGSDGESGAQVQEGSLRSEVIVPTPPGSARSFEGTDGSTPTVFSSTPSVTSPSISTIVSETITIESPVDRVDSPAIVLPDSPAKSDTAQRKQRKSKPAPAVPPPQMDMSPIRPNERAIDVEVPVNGTGTRGRPNHNNNHQSSAPRDKLEINLVKEMAVDAGEPENGSSVLDQQQGQQSRYSSSPVQKYRSPDGVVVGRGRDPGSPRGLEQKEGKGCCVIS